MAQCSCRTQPAQTAAARPQRGAADASFSRSLELPCSKVFVGGLSSETEERDLTQYFGAHGDLIDVYCKPGRGFGFVTFRDRAGTRSLLRGCVRV